MVCFELYVETNPWGLTWYHHEIIISWIKVEADYMINFNVIVDLILLTIVCENVDHVMKLLSLSLRLVSII